MRFLKWLLLLPVVVFPYSFFFVPDHPSGNGWIRPGRLWLVGLVCALALIVLSLWGGWRARSMAMASMMVKLLQIPAYVIWFLIGVILIVFLGPILTLLVDTMAIALSGLVGLAAVVRCKQEGVLTGKQAVLYGVLQFVFCADVISAIILYRKTKEVSP